MAEWDVFKRVPWWVAWPIAVAAFVALGALGGWMVGDGLRGAAIGAAFSLLIVASGVVAALASLALFYLPIVVHEMGHLAIALLIGFRFYFMSIGAVTMARTSRGWRISRQSKAKFSGGMTAVAPQRPEGAVRGFVLVLAGGILASLVYAGAWWLGGRVLGLPSLGRGAPAGLELVSFFWLVGLAISAYVALLALLPYSILGLQSDSALLLHGLRRTKEFARWRALVTLGTISLDRVRPRDWDVAMLTEGALIEDDSIAEALVRHALHLYCLDTGDLESALSHAERALACIRQCSDVHPQIALLARCDVAYAKARLGDPVAARQAYEEAVTLSYRQEGTLARAHAALLLAEGDFAGARTAAEDALKALDDAPMGLEDCPEAQREWLRGLLTEIEGRQPQDS